MKVLLTHRPGGAYGYVSEGWFNALRAGGHDVQRWDGQRETWDAFQPDLYIGCSGHRQGIPPLAQRGKTAVAIHVNPFGPVDLGGINEPADAIRWTVSQHPTVVFGYGHETDRELWSHWTTRHQIPWVPMPTAGDSTIYKIDNDLTGGERDIDVGYVGGYWPYKAQNLDRFIKPLIEKPGNLKMEMRGWGDWPKVPAYKGGIEDAEVPDFLNRVKVGPCVTEPHTVTWGFDLPERLWKVALCGAVVVHHAVKGLDRYMPSALVAGTPEQFHILCREWSVCSNEKRREVATAQRHEVLKSHTYFKRMATLFMAVHEATGSQGNFGNEALKLAVL